MLLPSSSFPAAVPLRLCLLLLFLRFCRGWSADDVWSGAIWERAQEARDKHASNSDRLMQHIWQQPERADRFVDCDILADSQTDKHFQFVNLYDADDAREKLLNDLPDDGYVRGMWPVKKHFSSWIPTVPYKMPTGIDPELKNWFWEAKSSWEAVATVSFKETKSDEKPHLEVVLDGGCFATLGYHATEPRKLSLHPGRCTIDVIMHLLGHVLGLPHPTSTVGRANEQYLMPHHAAPRSMGVLKTRAGAAFDPFDIMAVDPWFCAVSNRSTWRPLRPRLYRWLSVVGRWKVEGVHGFLRRSASTGLMQREIQMQLEAAGTGGCTKKCQDPCQEFVDLVCSCYNPLGMSDNDFEKLAAENGFWKFDLGQKLSKEDSKSSSNIKILESPKILVLFHSTDFSDRDVRDQTGVKCWHCSLYVITLKTRDLFNSEENRLIALGSRCSLFTMEVNGAVEEAWYRLCLHHLLHAREGDVELSFRGPGSVLVRYFSSEEVFPEFHRQFMDKVRIAYRVEQIGGCKCADGPELEIQNSVNKH